MLHCSVGADSNAPPFVLHQIAQMFSLADKDHTGSITFEEFYKFLQEDNKKEAAKQKDVAIAAQADPALRQQLQLNGTSAAFEAMPVLPLDL